MQNLEPYEMPIYHTGSETQRKPLLFFSVSQCLSGESVY